MTASAAHKADELNYEMQYVDTDGSFKRFEFHGDNKTLAIDHGHKLCADHGWTLIKIGRINKKG